MTAARQLALPDEIRDALDAWAAAPSAHPTIGDWRMAGYRAGRAAIPAPSRILTADSFGIEPNTDQDVAASIQAALDEVGRTGGGVLLLSAGQYRLDRPILMRHSDTVLRGAGRHKTVLRFPHPLAETLGIALAPDDVSTCWSWGGGQIFFISPELFASRSAAEWSITPPLTEAWNPGAVLAEVGAAPRGETVLAVDSTARLVPGTMVLLEQDSNGDHALLRRMAADVPGASGYDWDTRAAAISGPNKYPDYAAFRWPVRVQAVLGPTSVRLEQPLKLAIDEQTPARLRVLGPTVHDSGVESLTIENDLREQTTHNINPGSNGVGFQAVHDCWARDIHVVNADMAFGMTAAKSCTLSGISAGGRSLHHFVICRAQSHDNLVEGFELHEFTIPAVPGSYLHGLNTEGWSAGNVYRRGVLHTGTFDSHRAMPFENLRTAITITNKDAVPGGALNAGPFFGARSVHWGIDVTNGNNLCIEITDVAPSSLTAGITGLEKPGSLLPGAGMDFEGDLGSETLAFGVDLGDASDLWEVQRAAAPVD